MAALMQAEIYIQAGRNPADPGPQVLDGNKVEILSSRRSVHSPEAASPSWSLPIA